MLGVRYLKVPATTFVMQLKNGKVVRSGPGLSFTYFAPTSVIVLIPLSSTNVPFVFNEVTQDFQDVSVQGSLTFRVREPALLASLLDYSVDVHGRYRSDDPNKLEERLVHVTQVRTRSFVQNQPLRKVLVGSEELLQSLMRDLPEAPALARLGVEILDVSILSIAANPEMAKALQAEAREQLLRQADEAIYARRNASVELERAIKENELQTEIAVAAKQRQVRETQMAADVALEEQRKSLVASRVENERTEANARADALRAMLDPVKEIDWRTLIAAIGGGDSRMLLSMAFEELAQNASKIGELNITPDLLSSLLRSRARDRE
jgi:regulator of protease activity HflC (stomatin/prohibitin superfamily)